MRDGDNKETEKEQKELDKLFDKQVKEVATWVNYLNDIGLQAELFPVRAIMSIMVAVRPGGNGNRFITSDLVIKPGRGEHTTGQGMFLSVMRFIRVHNLAGDDQTEKLYEYADKYLPKPKAVKKKDGRDGTTANGTKRP